MEHIANHFDSGRTLERSRPDFGVIRDMRIKGCISKEDFAHAMNHTERPLVDTLRPYNYVPKELKEKERIDNDRANRVIVTDSRHERRRGKKQVRGESNRSGSNTVVLR
jgi:hypothetical protein